MKCTRTSLFAALALTGMICVAPAAIAQDTNTTKQPALGQRPPGRPGDRLAAELKLTDEQNTKVKALTTEQREKGAKLRQDTALTPEQRREKSQALREDFQKKMKEILTPEQYQKWEKMRAEMRPGRPGGPEGKDKKKAE